VRPRTRLLRGLVFACSLAAAACAMEFRPQPGQAGKDVIWLPTADSLVEKMLDLAQVTPQDYVVDLGSGDGRTVIAAARRDARALGIEFNADMVELSRHNAEKAGVNGKASFIHGDIFQADFSEATVVTMFLLTNLNLKLRPQLLRLRPGTRVVSNTFRMGEWQPDGEVTTGCGSFCTAYLWIVPANVDGFWRSTRGELALVQEFQRVYGTLKSGAAAVAVTDGRLRGREISFSVGGARYAGTVKGNAIEGTVTANGAVSHWGAARVPL
jgi:SAM-dependent methyltransferase